MPMTSTIILEGQAWRVFNALHELLKNETLHAEDHIRILSPMERTEREPQ